MRLLLIIQIVLLSLVLLVILFFRDLIATGASGVVGAFGSDDIQVQAPAKTDTPDAQNTQNDAPEEPQGAQKPPEANPPN